MTLSFSRAQENEKGKTIEWTVEELKNIKSVSQLLKYNSECTPSSWEMAGMQKGTVKNSIGDFKDLEKLKSELLASDRGKKTYLSVTYQCMGKNENKNFGIVIKSK